MLPAEAARELLRRREARRSLLGFTRYTFPDYRPSWHHEILCSYLDRWAAGEIPRLIVNAPPQHGKSELVSRRLPAKILGDNPDASIITCSYSADLSQRLNRDVQRIIDGAEYRALFPDTRLFGKNVRTMADGTYLRNSDLFEVVGRKGVYRSAGIGGGITGMGATHGIIDDPIKDDEEAYSPTQRQKIIDWYRGTFLTRLRKGAPVLVTMTRWHRSDLVGWLLSQAEENADADQWTVLAFEAERDEEPREFEDPRALGKPLWPEFKGADELAKIKVTMGPTRWGAMYQRQPRAEGGSEWPDSFFSDDIWFEDWPKTSLLKTAALDPSKGKDAKWGDYSAIVSLAYAEGVFYVDADMRNDRPVNVIVDTSVELQRTFGAHGFGIEANAFQELLANDVQRRSAELGVPFPAYLIDNRVNKQVRIRRLTPYLSQGMIRFKGGSPGAGLLVQQLRDFPNADHDDGPDALEMALRLACEIQGAPMFDDGLGNRLIRG